MIFVEDLFSVEYYQNKNDASLKQVLHDISFEVLETQSMCIVGNRVFEQRLLLDIIANNRPYQKGRCVLIGKGMMRKKRLILPHVFYIGSTNMLYNNMTVLEYLMFITVFPKSNDVLRQKQILTHLVDLGLGFMSLMPIAELTPQEKSVVTLLAAGYTDCKIVVWNLPRLVYEDRLLRSIKLICNYLFVKNKTLIFSTTDYRLADLISSHILVLKDGGIFDKNTLNDFTQKWDKLHYSFMGTGVGANEQLNDVLSQNYNCIIQENMIQIKQEINLPTFLALLEEYKIYPDNFQKNKPNVENAMKEVFADYDL